MADRTCIQCKKIFDLPYILKRHQNNKRPCAPIVAPGNPAEQQDSKCRFCNRVYSSASAMRYHIRTSCKIAPNAKNGNAGMELLYEHTLQQRVMALEAQNAEMLALMRQMAVTGAAPASALALTAPASALALTAPASTLALTDTALAVTAPVTNMTVETTTNFAGPVTNTTLAAGEIGCQVCNVTNMDVNKSITFNTFGKESLAHANSDRIRVILDESLRDTSSIQAAALMAVTKTAMLIYSDPDHPENLTCYMPNKKTNDVLAHTERGWEIFPASVVINQIGQKTIDHIFDRQPHENANHYTLIMKELQQNEQAYIIDSIFRPVLIRNRCLLEVSADVLPKSGTP